MKSSEMENEMSTREELKEYLLGKDEAIGYLLNDDNNSKTVMLSGAWGSGKTHFWQNEIVCKQSKIIVNKRKRNKYSAKELKEGLFTLLKKKKKTCVYISLYGKDNIEDIKSEVFTKAYAQIPKKGNKDKNIDTAIEWLGYGSKIASAVSVFGVKIETTKMTDGAKDYQDNEKLSEAQEAIRDGGVICFDDFERKSKHIDLNDLFGVLTQLSLEFNCKVVIILNSDVFEGEEANVFKAVKEKTVNKYFYFEPTIEELFDSIYSSDDKYKRLDEYKTGILNAIKETEELNARIYIQVLDNCLEWIDKGYKNIAIRALVLSSVYFIKTNYILSFPTIKTRGSNIYALYYDNDLETYDAVTTFINNFGFQYRLMKKSTLYEKLIHEIHTKKKHSNVQESDILEWLKNNYDNLFIFVKYGYKLYIADGIDESLYNDILNFIKTGILPKKPKEVESSLPLKVN